MKIPAKLPITAEQSRASRFQLGLTQAQVIDDSQLPGYKLKQFETGRFVPDMPFLESLRGFYETRGITFDQPEKQQPAKSPVQSDEPASKPGASIWRPVPRMALYVRDDLPEAELMKVFERMDANDARIETIMLESLKSGFVSEFSEETEAKSRELFGAMAENYLLFRHLQGRSIISAAPASPPATHGDLIASLFAQSPLAIGSGNTVTRQKEDAEAPGQGRTTADESELEEL
ncbi:hypothetical protein [Rhodocyclus tenuis]|uniref:Transcriptional regulator with XRE-family HTH domain n=1 Tax=Rhodocyclus tenuis TaxID=1066 RepID=A0A840GJ91_RHOTE|nr:hypothetical protein [Rhodocyclus tenuis]MBB4248512.1 transcriptional regulator with XRE-family HTH domain [Rhodocyclus tenuis]